MKDKMRSLTPYQNYINGLIKRCPFYLVSAYIQMNGRGSHGEWYIFTKDEKISFLKNMDQLSKDCPDLFIGFEHLRTTPQ